jgi:CARDB
MLRTRTTAHCLAVIAVLSTAAVCAQTAAPARKQTQPAQVQQQPQPQPTAAGTGTLTSPNDPQPTRPDPDVGEAKQRAPWPPHGKVDLALVGALSFGGTQIPWGNIASIPEGAALSKNNGRCVFAYRYATRNQGGLASVATQNRIMLGTQAGPILASSQLPALAAGASGGATGKLVLNPGESMIYVHADASALNVESDEANNLRRVRVTVTGDCR